jgi:ribosomal subunit interface protein
VNIVIRSQGVAISRALHVHCRERVERALRPFQAQVAFVELALVGQSGPRKVLGQVCRVSVELSTGECVRFESCARNYYEAAGHAAIGAGRHVARLLERRRAHSHERFMPLEAS